MDENDVQDVFDSEGDIVPVESREKVTGIDRTKAKPLPKELAGKVNNFSVMQRRYAEYRAKGLKQADAALKAGSRARDRGTLGRVGYNLEQVDGMKEYIAYLYEKRARSLVVDELELVEKLRMVFEEGIESGNLTAANKATELLGMIIGAFTPTKRIKDDTSKTQKSLEAFKETEIDMDLSSQDKLKVISSIMRKVNNGNMDIS